MPKRDFPDRTPMERIHNHDEEREQILSLRVQPGDVLPIERRAELERRLLQVSEAYTDLEIDKSSPVIARLRSNDDSLFASLALDLVVSELRIASLAIDKLYMSVSFYAAGGPTPGNSLGDVESAGGLGFMRRHEDGVIYWRRDLGAHWVHGAINSRHLALAGGFFGVFGEVGFLGYPITDELLTSVAEGRVTHFEFGSIYWHPVTGAFEIHGAIRTKWNALGGEQFGFPATDESATEDGAGRFNHFCDVAHGVTTTGSSIYCAPGGDTHSVHLAIRSHWLTQGGPSSYLGYPVTDQGGWSDPDNGSPGFVSHFQRGAVAWSAETGGVVGFPDRVVLHAPVVSRAAVDGWVEVTLASSGFFRYAGHLHNSGLVGLGVTVATAVRVPGTQIALTLPTLELDVGGTSSFDGRDEDWDKNGDSAEIRAHWDALRSGASVTTMIDAELGVSDFFNLIFLPLVGALKLTALSFGQRSTNCDVSGMHTVRDGNNNTIAVPSGVRCGLPGPPP